MDRTLPLAHNWGNIEYINPHPKMKKKVINWTPNPKCWNLKYTTPKSKLFEQ
jgi:hypothetical protein